MLMKLIPGGWYNSPRIESSFVIVVVAFILEIEIGFETGFELGAPNVGSGYDGRATAWWCLNNIGEFKLLTQIESKPQQQIIIISCS